MRRMIRMEAVMHRIITALPAAAYFMSLIIRLLHGKTGIPK
jgi:hypothetical protein